MDFERLMRKEGLGLAVLVKDRRGEITEGYLDTLPFDQLHTVYCHADKGSGLSSEAFRRMTDRAESFEEWETVNAHAEPLSDAWTLSFGAMVGSAREPEHFAEIVEHARRQTRRPLDDVIAEMIDLVVMGFDGWLAVCKACEPRDPPVDIEAEDCAIGRLERFDVPFSRWYEVLRNAREGSRLKSMALKKMMETARSFKEWTTVALWTNDNSEDRLRAVDKLNALVPDFDSAYRVCLHYSVPDTPGRETTYARILKLAETTDEFCKTWRVLPEGHRLKPAAAEGMFNSAKTLEEMAKVWRTVHQDDSLRARALAELVILDRESD